MKRISLLFLLIVLVGCQDKPKVEQKREPIVTQPEVEPQTTVSINQYKVIDTGQMKFFDNFQSIPEPTQDQPFLVKAHSLFLIGPHIPTIIMARLPTTSRALSGKKVTRC
jgi:hypothetical protein